MEQGKEGEEAELGPWAAQREAELQSEREQQLLEATGLATGGEAGAGQEAGEGEGSCPPSLLQLR